MSDLNQWKDFVDTFRLPVSMSLIGALIGHFRKNGVIQLPYIVMSYEKGTLLSNPKNSREKVLRAFYLTYDFLRYLIGVRFSKRNDEKALFIDLGFLGDLLVGVGTGIAAKTVVQATNTTNQYAVISASLLAGIAGMSYFQKWQSKDEANWIAERGNDFDSLIKPDPTVPIKRNRLPTKPRRPNSTAEQEVLVTQQQVAVGDEDKQ